MSDSLTLRVNIGEEVREIALPTFTSMTLGDYVRITVAPDDEMEHEMIARVLKMEPYHALGMKAYEATAVLQWYYDAIEQGAKEWSLVGQIESKLNDSKGETWNKADVVQAIREAGRMHTHINVDGIEYQVPNDLDVQTMYGQWVDLEAALDNLAKDKTEVELFPHILAALCTVKGEEYRKVDGMARRKVFEGAKAVDAYRAVAFFFSNSQRFAALMLRHFPNFLESRPQPQPPVLRVLPRDGVSGLH